MALKHLLPRSTRAQLFVARAKFFALFKKAGFRLGLGKWVWRLALPSEVKFWADYLASRGASCKACEEFNFRISPGSELQPWFKPWLDAAQGANLRLLDVGAGPLTWIGKKWAGRKIEIEAIDPLAEAYDEIMKRHGIVPPVRTKKGDGERVLEMFGPEQFDLAFARNCLDHSYDAIHAVTSMVDTIKTGGILFLWHNEDEAESLNYQGLHQWNFRLRDGELILWKGNRSLNVNQSFAGTLLPLRCEIKDGMIEAVYKKVGRFLPRQTTM